jgi:hypothetical protein
MGSHDQRLEGSGCHAQSGHRMPLNASRSSTPTAGTTRWSMVTCCFSNRYPAGAGELANVSVPIPEPPARPAEVMMNRRSERVR